MHLQDKYRDIYDGLIEVGIFQTNALTASKFINKIINEPLKWWNEKKVQDAKKEFLNKNFGTTEKLIEFLMLNAK